MSYAARARFNESLRAAENRERELAEEERKRVADHKAAERRGRLHEQLSKLVQEHGLKDVQWMLGVLAEDLEEAGASK